LVAFLHSPIKWISLIFFQDVLLGLPAKFFGKGELSEAGMLNLFFISTCVKKEKRKKEKKKKKKWRNPLPFLTEFITVSLLEDQAAFH
jgi:hypothetical protein